MHRITRALVPGILLLTASAAPLDPGGAGKWEGRYAMELRIGSRTRVPVVGTERSVTRTLLLVDVSRHDGRWVQRQSVCDVSIQSERIRMMVPPAFVAAIPTRQYENVTQGPGDARAYTADLGLDAIGFDPAVTGGVLPRDGGARGVVDSDGDGAPGATVVGHFPLFGRVRLFIAQRTHLVLRGRQVSDDRIEGTLDIRILEQRTLGADNRLFRRNLPMQAEPERSGFAMVRTTAGDCAALKGQQARLFPDTDR